MKGLSEEIELSIDNMLEGMVLTIDILKVEDDRLAKIVASRTDSFSAIKKQIVSWQNGPNAPSHEKLKNNITKLVLAGENSIDILRKALRRNIDFESLDIEKHGIASQSKTIILKAINDINAGVLELRNQIEADKFDLQERDFKRGFPEKFANQEFYPTKNYHKEWYDVETDSVMICPLGTKGEIITLDGLNIMLPKKPKQTEILYHRLPKEQQYWRRTEMPKGLTPDTEEAFTEFILKEFKRRREGLWFMNNGKAVYVTPEHYMGMQWNQMADTGGYKDFRIAQANMYYFAKACLVDRRSIGMFFTKGRRTGFTEMAIDHIVELSTTTKNQKIGITSKSDTDAAVVFQKYSYVIQNLPFFFQPVVKGKIDDIKKMVFGKPSDNSRAAKKNKDTSTSDYLNTTVDYRATALLSYDSVKLNFYFGDEASKWEYLSYLEHWANIEPTMIQGGRVVGKAFIGSTLNPMKKGGEDFKKMDIGSNVLKRNENGSTSTGLYAYFLPAHQNAEDYTDKYGVCHTVVEKGKSFVNAQGELKLIGALQYFETDFKSKRLLGEKNYWNARRLNPITKIDAFRDESVSTLLNEEKINEQLDHNELYDTRKTLVRGNFSWENIQERSGDVIWTPTEKGRFLVAWLPTEDLRNKKIMKRNEFGHVCFHPLNDDLGAFGIDTYDQDSTQGSELENTENGSEYNGGSKGAMLGLTGTTLKNVPNNFFFLEYITRPQTAEIFFEDCLMACVFYGMPALIESNKMRLLMHFRNRGYRGYSINRFDKPMSKISQTEKDLGGIPSSGADIITSHWTGLESYIDKYVGNYHQGQNDIAIREEGEMGSMPFERTLRDWAKFNVKDRTAFDASIASGYAVMAVNRRPYIEPKPPTSAVSIKFATYT